MGVLNVTPDSFSDGGKFLDPGRALEWSLKMSEDGADIIDIGAESSRPGASIVDVEEEWRRLEPILSRLSQSGFKTPVSVDTYKPEIMVRLNDYGVAIVNDIKGGADEPTLRVLAEQGLIYVAMHMHRSPGDMQMSPLSGKEAVIQVQGFYDNVEQKLKNAGFEKSKIWLDPGIGFGKDDEANLKLLQQSLAIGSDKNILLGISRKSFMGRLLDLDNPLDRDPPSKMLEATFLMCGIKCIRTHDVKRLSRIRSLLEA